jgi:hypothetical protein
MKPLVLFTAFLILIFSSCNNKLDIKRNTFLGLKLGSTTNEIEKQLEVLRENQMIFIAFQNVPYLKGTVDEKGYFMTPLFTKTSGDSIITTIRVLYLDNLDYIKDDIRSVQANETPMNLQFVSKDRVNSFLLKEQVKKELIGKYGNPTSQGVLKQNGEMELISWDDKDGIDIILTYKTHRDVENEYGNSGLILEYTFNKKLSSQIKKATKY